MALAAAALLIGLAAAAWTPDLPRAPLESTYARGPQDFVTIDGMRLHLRDDGPRDAPAVLLLHGFGGSLHTWDAWARGLGATHRVVRFDQPGAGLSAPDRLRDDSDERGLQVIAAVLDALGLLRASLAPAYADAAVMTDAIVDRYRDLLLAEGNRQALLDRMGQLVLKPPEPWLARITAPTLLVWGAQDRMIPVANAADYQRLMPPARLLTLPGAGHLPQEEAADAALPALTAFLRD